MSSLEKVSPGMRPRFLSQKMAAKEPLKNMPSTAAKATRRWAKEEFWSAIQRSAQSAFLRMQGTVIKRVLEYVDAGSRRFWRISD